MPIISRSGAAVPRTLAGRACALGCLGAAFVVDGWGRKSVLSHYHTTNYAAEQSSTQGGGLASTASECVYEKLAQVYRHSYV
ncbi:unnamed protein product, partial [Iphiclides podalirius]